MKQELKNTRSSHKIGLGGILLRIALILACFVMLCIHLSGGLFAKYSSTGNSSDSARVAKFDVEITGEASEDVVVTCNPEDDTARFLITIHNDSEVAVSYFLTAEYTPIPGVSHSFDSASGTIPVGPDQEATCTLSFSVSDWEAFSAQADNTASFETTLDFKVIVRVEQVD